MKILIFAAIVLLCSVPAFCQGQMISNYAGDLEWSITPSGGNFTADVAVTGNTVCQGGPCPSGVTHSADIEVEGNGGQYGGTWTDLDPVAPQSEIYAEESFTIPAPVWINITANADVKCSRVGTLASFNWFDNGTVETAVAFSYTTSGTSNMQENVSTCGNGFYTGLDWAGLSTNPYGIYPSQTSYQYIEAQDVCYSTSSQSRGPFTCTHPSGGPAFNIKGWTGSLPQLCTKASTSTWPVFK